MTIARDPENEDRPPVPASLDVVPAPANPDDDERRLDEALEQSFPASDPVSPVWVR